MLKNLGNQTDDWSYENRMKGEALCGYEYSETLAGPEGVHIHFWIPQTMRIDLVPLLARKASYYRDIVSYSYGHKPENLNEPVVFKNCSWSVSDILEVLEFSERNLHLTDKEIHTALIYAALHNFPHSEADIVDAIIEADEMLRFEKGDIGMTKVFMCEYAGGDEDKFEIPENEVREKLSGVYTDVDAVIEALKESRSRRIARTPCALFTYDT